MSFITLPEDFKDHLNTKIIAHPLYIYSQLESTQATARHLAEQGGGEGTVVLAYRQNKGVGKRKRDWFSPLGGIWLTLIIKPLLLPAQVNWINVTFTLAVAKTLSSFLPFSPVIKWPNDVLLKNKKGCGILTQIKSKGEKIEYALVGIGINLNLKKKKFPQILKDKVTSLEEELGKRVDMADFLYSLFEMMEKYYLELKAGRIDSLREEWLAFALPSGCLIRVVSAKKTYQGQFVGIGEEGALILRGPYGQWEEVREGDMEIIENSK